MSILSIWEHLQVIFGSSGSDLGGLRGCREGCLGHFCVFWGWFGGLRGCRGGCLGNPGALGGHVGGMFAPTWRHAGAKLGVFGIICSIFVLCKFNFNLEGCKHEFVTILATVLGVLKATKHNK